MIPNGKPGKRRYGCWAGSPEGVLRCIESVYGTGRYMSGQCSRKRGHGFLGNFCKQHAKFYPAQPSPQETASE